MQTIAMDFWRDLTARARVVLVSPLSRESVVQRLREAVDSEWSFGGDKSVVGHVGDDRFRLRLRIGYRNSFQTFVFCEMKRDGRGTRIEGRCGMHPFAAIFMTAWIGAVAVLALAAVSGVMTAEAGAAAQGAIWLVPIIMVGFGVGLVALGRWLARNERERLVAFLEQTIEARAMTR